MMCHQEPICRLNWAKRSTAWLKLFYGDDCRSIYAQSGYSSIIFTLDGNKVRD